MQRNSKRSGSSYCRKSGSWPRWSRNDCFGICYHHRYTSFESFIEHMANFDSLFCRYRISRSGGCTTKLCQLSCSAGQERWSSTRRTSCGYHWLEMVSGTFAANTEYLQRLTRALSIYYTIIPCRNHLKVTAKHADFCQVFWWSSTLGFDLPRSCDSRTHPARSSKEDSRLWPFH